MRAEALRRRLEESRRVHYADSEDSDHPSAQPLVHGARGSKLQYCVRSTGARVSLSNAKSLLFDFCNKLPSDRCVGGMPPPWAGRQDEKVFVCICVPACAHALERYRLIAHRGCCVRCTYRAVMPEHALGCRQINPYDVV